MTVVQDAGIIKMYSCVKPTTVVHLKIPATVQSRALLNLRQIHIGLSLISF